ncbi:MAG: ATP-binding protein, partial [Chloroflexota bacterium]
SGEVIALVGINRDISDHKRAEMTLNQEKELSEAIINTLPGIFFFYDITDDLNGRLVRWNQNFERLAQYTVAVMQKMKILDWFSTEEQPRIAEAVRETLSRRIVRIEADVLDISGRPVPYLYNMSSMTMGERRYLVGTGLDVQQHKLAEEGLRRSEALLRALLDATTDVAFLMAADGTFLTANKTLAQSMMLTVEAMAGRPALELLPPDIEAYRRQFFDQAAQTGKPVRWEDESGSEWWDNSIYPVLSATGALEAFAVYSRNMTESKHLQAELQRYAAQLEQMVEERTGQLRRAKEQIELILNNTSDALALSQANGDIQTLNPAFTAMFDEQTASAIEHILWAIPNGEQIATVSQALLNVIYDSKTKRVEAQIVAKDGKDRDIDLALIPVHAGDGAERPGILVSARDITHLKEIERFKARFVADAVHDLATPISGLGTRLYMLKRAPERLEEHIRALENQVDHLRNLLADLRTLSQLDYGNVALSLEICNLNVLVQRVFDTYEPVALQRRQSFQLIADPALPNLSLDSRQIERVLVNLVSNAIQYTPDERAITIRTFRDDGDVMVSVADHGMGIGAEDLPHIFDRFYRTTPARQTESDGTGLGLAIVKEIVELHGGRITVTSEPGSGSIFVVRLPIRR